MERRREARIPGADHGDLGAARAGQSIKTRSGRRGRGPERRRHRRGLGGRGGTKPDRRVIHGGTRTLDTISIQTLGRGMARSTMNSDSDGAKPLSQIAYDALRSMILSGEVKPGERLRERE